MVDERTCCTGPVGPDRRAREKRCGAPASRREGLAALPLVLALLGVLVVIGMSGSLQSSMDRAMLSRVACIRSVDRAAASAFEEISARLEARFASLPLPEILATRDLGRMLEWPAQLEPELARAAFVARDVELGPVSIRTSSWLGLQMYAEERGSIEAIEMGYLELSVPVTVRAGKITWSRRVTARRVVHAVRAGPASPLQLRVQGANLHRWMQQEVR